MKKLLPFALCTALIVLSFSGCILASFGSSGPGAVTGIGDLERYEINVDRFNKIRVEGYCEIRYHSVYSNSVILEVQPNLREYFRVEVINGELIISTTRNINVRSSKTPVLTISTPVLNNVFISGAVTFTAFDTIAADSFAFNLSGAGEANVNLDVNNFTVDISGAGNLNFSGIADTAYLSMSGAGELNALNLEARRANVNLTGAGLVRISCSDFLNINASGMGSVEYKGSPSVTLNNAGLVRIRSLD